MDQCRHDFCCLCNLCWEGPFSLIGIVFLEDYIRKSLEVLFHMVGMSLYMRFFLRILRLGCFDKPCFRKLTGAVRL